NKANQLASYLINDRKVKLEERVGILIENSIDQVIAVLGTLKAGATYIPIDVELPEERIAAIIDDSEMKVLISSKKHIKMINRLQWQCTTLETYMCMDTKDVHNLEEEEKSNLMNKKLWEYVGQKATDEITGGGWSNSYTGESFTEKEMDEYGDNVLKKLMPYLNKEKRVLEVGCASGISMYRIAPLVKTYYGTDLSEAIINVNKVKNEKEGIKNIRLKALPAHDIDKINEDSFDVIIINSVVQCFHGHNYLRNVLKKLIDLLAEDGMIFIGDIMDQESKKQLIDSLINFKSMNTLSNYRTKTDWSEELFLSRSFFRDLQHDFKEIRNIEFSNKIYTIENELTKYRYDAMLFINKRESCDNNLASRFKNQHDANDLDRYDHKNINIEIPTNSTAYIIYTSGTSGNPKGVMIKHKSLINLCLWNNEYYEVTESDNATRYAGFGFDASVWELFPYLVAGATVHVISKNLRLDIKRLNNYFEENNITISFLPTQICEQFQRESNGSLRYLLTGGDKLRIYNNNKYKLANNYGPTENTVVTTSYIVEEQYNNMPIGKPISNVKVHILDRNNRIQPIGAKGELCISGVGLASGYLNNDRLTKEKFVESSFQEEGLIYKTGDLASWLPDGNIQFWGRNDQQVKIRAYRIELSDIEAKLQSCEYINDAVVIVREDSNKCKYLCAYYVSGKELQLEYLKYFLATKLPEYMVPEFFIRMDTLPLTVNGKIDKKKLPEPDGVSNRNAEYIAPRNEIEQEIASIWRNILEVSKIGINDNFFDLGGNSLKAIRVVSKMSANFEVDINDLFSNQTISEFSKVVRYKKDNFKNNIEKVKNLYLSDIQLEHTMESKVKAEDYIKSIQKYRDLVLTDKNNDHSNILLFGGTGFLGINLIYELLNTTNCNLYVIVRSSSLEKAQQRICSKLEYHFGNYVIENYSDRLFILCGDLTQDNFGLKEEEYNKLALTIDCIINSAANVSHYGHYEEFYEVNVVGVERLIKFAFDKKIKDLNHISTIGVASGKIEGQQISIFTEDDFNNGQVSNNYYIQTKLEAEMKLIAARESGLNANIFRVGNLICNSQTGIFQENIEDNGFYKIIKAFINLGKMPIGLHKTLDFSFIDYVRKAVVSLMGLKELKNEVYHIFNNNYIELPDLAQFLRQYGINIDSMEIDEYLDYLYENYDDSEKTDFIESIILHSQMFELLDSTYFEVMATKTNLILQKLGFEWPEVKASNINKMLEHCEKVGFI
uniref:AMP-binding protein n=1 Tax=Clostridium sp. C8-1-8 TaxID=2698831 RepID=UPI00136F0F9F